MTEYYTKRSEIHKHGRHEFSCSWWQHWQAKLKMHRTAALNIWKLGHIYYTEPILICLSTERNINTQRNFSLESFMSLALPTWGCTFKVTGNGLGAKTSSGLSILAQRIKSAGSQDRGSGG